VKTVEMDESTLDACVNSAAKERVVVLRDGQPVAIVVGVAGLDEDQIELGADDAFWRMIRERRKEGTMPRAELENRLRCEENPKVSD
jgi:PHD/YefM family antitoxin component YafN of YafNO toxin-antitoxin module